MSTKENDDTKPLDEVKSGKLEKSVASFDSTSLGSTSDRDPKHVFVDANRDVLMEIGYLTDKARLVEALRTVEWDPTFWSLNDEIVGWIVEDENAIRRKISELQLSISEKEAYLVTTRKKLRLKNRERGIYDPALDVFPKLVEPPNMDEPFNDFGELADIMCKLIRDLEMAKIMNLENELQLASMEVKLRSLREDLKYFEERNKNFNVNAHLLAVEMQNSMLNELLNSIMEKIKQTTQDMENLKSKDPQILITIIKETSDLNYRIIGECYPQMESKPGVSQWLWLPHDVKYMSLEDYLKTMDPIRDHTLATKIDWKQRKKDVKEVAETRDQLLTLKRKLKWHDRRKACGEYGTIQYLTEKEVKDFTTFGPTASEKKLPKD